MILLAIALFPSFAGLAIPDPVVFFPCFSLSWIASIWLCIEHQGRHSLRGLAALVITAFFIFVGWRAHLAAQRSESVFKVLAARAAPASLPNAPAPSPPITLVNIRVLPPYEVGKRLRFEVILNNNLSGLIIRGTNTVAVGIASDSDLTTEKRRLTEKELWKNFEAIAPKEIPQPLTTIVGLMTMPVDAIELTERDVRNLNDKDGIIYVLGQIGYGTGTLDYCAFIQPAREQSASLCMEHNGPASRRAFK